MSLDVGAVVGHVKFTLDDSGLKKAESSAKSSAIKVSREFQSSGKASGQALSDGLHKGLGSDASRLGRRWASSFTGAVKPVITEQLASMGAMFAVDKIVGFFRESTMAASDLNETINATQTIYKGASAAQEAFASTAADKLGLSKRATLDFSNQIGGLLIQLGDTAEEAGQLSQKTIQLATDLGSMRNLDTADVLERINAALIGEYDGLQKVIPGISGARVQQEALALSGKKSADALTEQEKAHAVLSIVQKDGAYAAGDFAKTQDSVANKLKRTNAAMEETRAKVGRDLQPVMQEWLEFLSTTGIEVIEDFSGVLVGIIEEAVPLARAVGQLVQMFADLPGPVQNSVLALAGLHKVGALRPLLGGVGAFFSGVAKGAKSASDEVGTVSKGGGKGLAGKMGGLASFIGGGPWGVALGVGVTALGLLAGAHASAAEKAKEQQRYMEDLRGTLNQVTGETTQATREMVAERLAADENAAALEKLGASKEDIISAYMGQEEAVKRITDLIDGEAQAEIDRIKAKQTAYDTGSQLDAMEMADAESLAEERRLTVREHIEGLQAQGQEVRNLTEWQKASGKVIDSNTDSFDKAAEGASDYTRSLEVQKLPAEEVAAAHKTLADAIIAVSNAQAGARGATRNYQEAIDAAEASVKENGKTLDVTAEKGRKNQAALDAIASSALSMAEANLKAGRSHQLVKEDVKAARDAFVDQAHKMGLSIPTAERLATKLGLTGKTVDALNTSLSNTPSEVKTAMEVSAADAVTTVHNLVANLDFLNGKTFTAGVRVNIGTREYRYTGTPGRAYDGIKAAAGGPVRGPGTGTSDSIPAMLSNGEHVITKREVDAAGGHGAVFAWRRQVLSQRFASGGPAISSTALAAARGATVLPASSGPAGVAAPSITVFVQSPETGRYIRAVAAQAAEGVYEARAGYAMSRSRVGGRTS